MAGLSRYNVPDDKIFYLETYDLYARFCIAAELIPDMSHRVKSLDSSDIDDKLAAISASLLQLRDMVEDLYGVTNVKLFPPSTSEQTTTSA